MEGQRKRGEMGEKGIERKKGDGVGEEGRYTGGKEKEKERRERKERT